VQAARPSGNNPTSVQVILSDTNLQSVIHTDDTYKGGDIFYLIAHLKGFSNKDSIRWVYDKLGFSVGYNKNVDKNSVLSFVNEFVQFDIKYDRYNTIENNILPDVTKEQFISAPHCDFTKEGISLQTQEHFGICYDTISSRIVIPIHDLRGNLITFKGRATKENDIRYIAYYSFSGVGILYGYYQNFFDIINSNEVILFESEKSVLKSHSCDICNTLAIMRHKLSPEQKNVLLGLQVPLTFGFDKDISASEILLLLDDLKGLVEINIMYDRNDLLDEKDAPIDKGIEVFNKLYNNRIKLEELEELVLKGVVK
jgi:DNA primase